jgi:hypothetical protein
MAMDEESPFESLRLAHDVYGNEWRGQLGYELAP